MSPELQAAIARAQTLQARSLGYRDAATRYDHEPTPETCSHPPARLYSWHAYDGTACVCCCDCGAVLTGGVDA